MTSSVDNLLPFEQAPTKRAPIVSWRILTAILAALAMVVILFLVPVPFVVNSPGPTFNVLGSDKGVPILEIDGTDPTTGEPVEQDEPQSASYLDPAKPGQGQLRMVTVSESGSPDSRLNFAQLIAAYLDPHSKIMDYESVYPEGTTRQQVSDAQLAMMRNSQTTSQVAALEYLGWDVPATVTIEGAVEGSNAEGIVEQGDILRAITTPDGTPHEEGSDGLYATGFRYYFTPLPGYFSPFPHGTGPLSVTKEYLGLTGGPAGFTRNFRGPALLGTCSRKTMSYVYGTVTHSGTASQPLPLQHRFVTPRPPDSSGKNTPTTPHVQRLPAVHTRTVWPPPLSLATTHGITVVFFSCGY